MVFFGYIQGFGKLLAIAMLPKMIKEGYDLRVATMGCLFVFVGCEKKGGDTKRNERETAFLGIRNKERNTFYFIISIPAFSVLPRGPGWR